MAEATIAIDPARPSRIAAAADPYRRLARIVVVTSMDTGATWSGATEILPPGFDKSYDPSLSYEPDGSILVVGGASKSGRPRCQPDSAIFGARIKEAGTEYFTIQRANPATYFDRPKMTRSQGGRVYVTWTQSQGSGAECRGSPVASKTFFTRSDGPTTFEAPHELPSSGLPAPFGASIAIGDRNRVWVAIGERDPGKVERVVAAYSDDDGATFSGPEIVAEGPPVPGSIPGLGGFVTAVPTITAFKNFEPVIAWAAERPEGAAVEVATRKNGRWESISPATPFQSLFPAVVYDREGAVRLCYLTFSGGSLTFNLQTLRNAQWEAPQILAVGQPSKYLEIGQFLGIASAGHIVAAAVPVDGLQASQLVVGTIEVPAAVVSPVPTPGASTPAPPARRASPMSSGIVPIVAAAAVVGALALVMARVRRR